jgi:hypothetical protein
MLEIFLFGYLKEFSGSINAFIYKSNGPIKSNGSIKRRDDDNNYGSFYKVIPAYEYHFYTISTLLSVGVIPPPNQHKTKQVHCIGHHS